MNDVVKTLCVNVKAYWMSFTDSYLIKSIIVWSRPALYAKCHEITTNKISLDLMCVSDFSLHRMSHSSEGKT